MLKRGRSFLSATTDAEAAVCNTDATFVIVPTPSGEDGTFSLDNVLSAMEAIGRGLREKHGYHLIALTSTVMPGSTGGPVRDTLERVSEKRCDVDFGLCYSPEFIALGSVIDDFLNPDFLLIGESDPTAGDMLAAIYREAVDNDPPVARVNLVNAELAKISVNTYVTMKISFANTLARMCERLPGAAVDEVTSVLGLDSRIAPRYLRGAISYGGPCFPRDNRALGHLARSLSVPALLAEATDATNIGGIDQLAQIVLAKLPPGGSVGILGLAYKPDTDVVEEAPGLLLAGTLTEYGVEVTAYDPAGGRNAKRLLGPAVRIVDSSEECVARSDVVVVTTAWPEFALLESETFAHAAGPPKTVIDCWRVLDRGALRGVVEYVALGESALIADSFTADPKLPSPTANA
jgi:UDPglucose 6-dehydrogenase